MCNKLNISISQFRCYLLKNCNNEQLSSQLVHELQKNTLIASKLAHLYSL